MRTNILISRMSRLVETAGNAGDGAALAEEYAAAVKKANARLEAVIAAADAKVVSDAIRLLSEDPPLLEEVSALDFFLLQDWESLCDMNSWTMPPKIDKQMMERAVELGETKDAIAPFLSMYKKAVRVNNVRLAVKSLRRLADLDHSQNWGGNLKQSERQLQTLIVEEFSKALSNQKGEDCDRLAQELLDGVWSEGIVAKGADAVRSYRDEREAEKREELGRENLAILTKCRDVKWNRKLAFSMVQAIDALVEKGWKVPEDGNAVLSDCRVRCAKEFEAEEAAKRWKDLNEQLHAAIQRNDCDAIRETLSAPEFLDRDPENDMLRDARRVIEHTEAMRRRKTLQIAALAFLGLVAILGVSGWWLKNKLFLGRCEDEALKLAYLEKRSKETPRYAIGGMTQVLSKLKAEDPDVYAYPKVNQFGGRLKIIEKETFERTNQIGIALGELEAARTKGWTNGVEYASVTGRLDEVERALVKDDADFRGRLLVVKNSWMDHLDAVEKDDQGRATKFHATLVSHLGTITERLTKELARKELNQEVENCKASLEEWRTLHSKYAVELEAKLAEAEKAFNEAVEAQRCYRESLGKLNDSKSAEEFLKARAELIEYHGNYPEVKLLKPLSVGVDEVKDVLSASPKVLKRFIDSQRSGISDEEFSTFIKENVLIIADSPEYYSLYGLMAKNDAYGKIVGVSKGKAKEDRPSYESSWKISCEDGILSFAKRTVVKEMKAKDGIAPQVLMPSSSEMKTVVDVANRSNLTLGAFESEVLKLIDRHISSGHEKGYVAGEEKFATYGNPIKGWMSPYRRVQFVAWYMRWLKEDLKLMPDDSELGRWFGKADTLSQLVQVDGVDEGLSWLCIWEDRIRSRQVECAKLLSEMPLDWVKIYRESKAAKIELREVGGWQVKYAGAVGFDPVSVDFASDPEVLVVKAPGVTADHPLYVLRKVKDRLVLFRAFEPGEKAPWRKCANMQKVPDGYVIGEPLYHVFTKGKFIDVQLELEEMKKRVGRASKDVDKIPLFTNGGN